MTVAKILPLHDLARGLEASRRAGLKIVQCHGCFDLMHIGHIRHLQAARAMGDLLVVTVTADAHVAKGEGRPAFTEALRAEALAALVCVDFVAISPWPTAVEAIQLLRPDYYVKGQAGEEATRHSARLQHEIATVRELGGDVRFTHEAEFSSTALLDAHFRGPDGLGVTGLPGGRAPGDPAARHFLEGFRARHAAGVVRDALAALRTLKVLVIGEAIIDEYRYCVPLGKAPKEPAISSKHVRLERHAGGALACANHVAGFCGAIDLVTGLGAADFQEAFIRGRLKPNVRARFFVREGAPTITKRRYVTEPGLLKLFEVAEMDDTPLPAALEDQMLAHLEAALPAYDLVIVADYGHGFLGPRTVDLLAARARYLAVNTQANPGNLGFHVITRYPRADYLCIDEGEARLATRDRWSPVAALASALRARVKCSAMSVTLAHEGVLVSGPDGTAWEVPALTRDVVDRMGAGDAYLAVSSPCAAARLPLEVVALLGSAAGALAVRIVGNRSAVEPAAVERLLAELLP